MGHTVLNSMGGSFHGYVKSPEGILSWFINPMKTIYIYIQCGAPKIAKLVYNSSNYGLW